LFLHALRSLLLAFVIVFIVYAIYDLVSLPNNAPTIASILKLYFQSLRSLALTSLSFLDSYDLLDEHLNGFEVAVTTVTCRFTLRLKREN
ncbi:hypothetical protein Tco_0833731, partial [Tanacetum coccineum]